MGKDAVGTFQLGGNNVRDVAMSADGSRAFATTTDGTIQIYDLATHSLVKSIDAGRNYKAITVSDDGKTLFAFKGYPASSDGMVDAITVATGAIKTYAIENGGDFSDIQVVDAGHVLVTGGNKQNAQLLDLATGTFSDVKGAVSYSNSATMVRDGNLTLLAEPGISDGPLFLYDARRGAVVAAGDNYQGGISGFNWGSVAVSEAAGLALQFIYYGTVKVYGLDLKWQKDVYLGQPIAGIDVDSAGKNAFVYFTDGTISEYSLADWSLVEHFTVQTGESFYGSLGSNLLVSPDGKYLTTLDQSPNAAYDLTLIDLSLRDEVFKGTAGADRFAGKLGDDTYYVTAGDTVIEDANAGFDTIVTATSLTTLPANVERIVLRGHAAIDAGGNSAANDLVGNVAANVLTGRGGADRLFGNEGNDTLDGGAGNDLLDGGAGADVMRGGPGDDTYVIDNAGDVVEETSAGDGTDTVVLRTSYVLTAAFIENVTLAGSANINATGNAGNNRLVGNAGVNTLSGLDGNDTLEGGAGADVLLGGAGDDRLDGGTGRDAMSGGAGNDTYVVDSLGDVVTEAAGEGVDVVTARISYTLSANVEQLVLLNSADALKATGNDKANSLTGNAFNNVLDGKAGADTMTGGAGNDTYIVDSLGDVVVENVDGGMDTVRANVSATLAANVENLVLVGSRALNGTGNAGNNHITGNAAANVLDGGGGYDTLEGGAGNDTYVVGQYGTTTIVEAAGGGIDTIRSAFDLDLGLYANVENARATGTAHTVISGNDASNVLSANDSGTSLLGGGGDDRLVGGAGNDYLDGQGGKDTLIGGRGDDTYIVASSDDTLVEGKDGGTDVVYAEVSMTLPDNIEVLMSSTAAAITLTGNALDNLIVGSSGKETLSGAAGNDQLVEIYGNDTLIGGAGADTFIITSVKSPSAIRISDFTEGTDKIAFASQYLYDASLRDDYLFIGTQGFNGIVGALRYQAAGADTQVQVDIDGDRVADITLTLTGQHVLHADDFVV
ncbi:hypothetical protein [Novosphingobium huizhouense]|uniref:hypothetical protein n=1 Tax=Novosphingobium huizhouense TaxID=2866625 RepID=UPI00296E84C8|nr:hypothetical protein [Novosphingobium huizhouense]